MAKRKEMTEKLTGAQPQGWQAQVDQAAEPAPEPAATETAKAGDYRRKTYLLTDELIVRIEALAEQEHVGLNELVRWLLDDSLSRIESGETELPTAPVQRRTLGA